MTAESSSDVKFEIGHVLLIDIVGYSELLIHEQRERLQVLNEIVRSTAQFRASDVSGMLVRIPTGDGMALIFRDSLESPVRCALEIGKTIKSHPEIQVRMGIHSGPVSEVTDVNERANIAGAGINMAQRVMDCGDAGHILLSRHVAEDLEQYRQWQPCLHDLGECEVKHGIHVHVVNLYTEELGNPEMPEKLKQAAEAGKAAAAISAPIEKPAARRWAMIGAVILMVAVIVTGLLIFVTKRSPTGIITSTPTGEKSIAVLPFENLSRDPDNAFFTDGVQDEILTDLAKIADLKVISRTSVMQYKNTATRNVAEIAQALKVAHVLEGSVQRSANRVRVSAQLIDARNDTHVWAEKYDRDLADVFAIQSEIAQKIADQLQAKLSPKEKAAMAERPTSDLGAYDLYLQAKELLYEGYVNPARERENDFKAVQLLDQAVARDPAFLLAYCLLAYAHDDIYNYYYDHTETRLALAENSIRAAIRLQPDSGETHLAQAIHFYWGYLNYDLAREELAKAQAALPNNARIFEFLGLIDRRQGRWDEAIRDLEHSLDLDPRNASTIDDLGDTYFKLRRYEDAIAMCNRALALEPRNSTMRTYPAGIGVAAHADMAPLRAVLNTIEAEGPAAAAQIYDVSFDLALCERDPAAAARALANIPSEGNIKYAFHYPHAWYEGLLAKLRQDAPAAHAAFTAARAETEKLVRAQPRSAAALMVLARIDAELGDKEKAIQEGRTACDMLPPTKDAVVGVYLIDNLARIYALTGEKDLALEQLDIVSKIPCGPSYGDLRLDPEWDSLRGDPRFDKIVASLAPKRW
jgi:TolB-like protein/class 3 adenylate cyclase/Tfp pilus assembly protein PilF